MSRFNKASEWSTKSWAVISSRKFIVLLYLIAGVVAPMLKFKDEKWNNIKIFFHSTHHLFAEKDLYAAYPQEYGDYYLYGPIFSVFAIPFAYLPSWLGVALFVTVTTLVFLWGVYSLNFTDREKAIFCLICFFDFLTNQQNFQTNSLIAGCILLSLGLIQRSRIAASTFCIAFGLFVKIYGGVALVLFLFTRHKVKFILYGLGWCVFLFFLPAVFSSLEFAISSYPSWFDRLAAKNASVLNTGVDQFGFQSLFDFSRRALQVELPQRAVLAGAAVLTLITLSRWKTWNLNSGMAELTIASAMVGIVIFSTGSESPTFIILQSGVALWFLYKRKTNRKAAWIGLAVMLIFSSLSPTDLFYGKIGETYSKLGMRALPCTLFWITILVEMWLLGRKDREEVQI